MSNERGKLVLAFCDAGRPFGNKVLEELIGISKKEGKEGKDIFTVSSEEKVFANGEIKTTFAESIRGSDIYIFQDVENSDARESVNDKYMALKTAIDAARWCDAKIINIIVPVFPYARQDKRKEKEGLTAAMVARELEDCGAREVITLDIHEPAIAGYFRKGRLENLHASKNIIDYIKSNIGAENLCIVPPDIGATAKAEYYANRLGVMLITSHKKRDYSKENSVDEVVLAGDLEGRRVLLVDDMFDTGGTFKRAVESLEKKGCSEAYFACSLPLFNGDAVSLLDRCCMSGILKEVISTDAVYHGGEEFKKAHPWFKEVSVAKYFARVIYNINHNMSISELVK